MMVSFLQVNVYQVLDSSKMNVSQGRKLLSSRLSPVHSSGWEVFTITQAVSTLHLQMIHKADVFIQSDIQIQSDESISKADVIKVHRSRRRSKVIWDIFCQQMSHPRYGNVNIDIRCLTVTSM